MRCALVGGADHQAEVTLRQHGLKTRNALPKDLSQSPEDVEAKRYLGRARRRIGFSVSTELAKDRSGLFSWTNEQSISVLVNIRETVISTHGNFELSKAADYAGNRKAF